MQFIFQYFHFFLYRQVEGIFFSKGFIDFISLLKMTLLEVKFSHRLGHHAIHCPSRPEPSNLKLENNYIKVNLFDSMLLR